MICINCDGKGTVNPFGKYSSVMVESIVCDDCGGSGIVHCCEPQDMPDNAKKEESDRDSKQSSKT